ncbi:MAG: protein translocase subunit SecD [Coriobacteriia bacterium]|nr:protein translocase subunit SecD [Coriobacteriia bacterium]
MAGTSRRNVWLIVITTILVVVSIVLFVPPQERINQGLDIQGGLSVVLTAKNTDGSAISDEDMEKSRSIIENRVNALGASEATVQVQGSDQILVQIPGVVDTEEALNTIGKTGKLEFARLDSFTDQDTVTAIENGQYASEGTVTDSFGNSFPSGQMQHLEVTPGTYETLITGDNISNVTVGPASEASAYYAVNLTLDSAGTSAFAQATKDLVSTNGQIVIILDNEVQSAPAVQSEITTGQVAITGNYSADEAKSLETILESGSLPVSFEYAQSQVVGPTLGQEALMAGLIAAIVGLILVMLYLLLFYKGLGLITAGAMLVFSCFYLGILAALSAFGLFSLSMAGIAGIVLTIGMAADSSILTIERFREEIRMGRSVKAASISGVRHAIQTSIDADLVTLVAALSLFFLASASVKGFGLTLALGVICDIVMMLLFKAPLIRLLAPKAIAGNPGFWGIKDSEEAAVRYNEFISGESVAVAEAVAEADADQDAEEGQAQVVPPAGKLRGRFIKKDINFLGYRRIFLIVAAVCMVACFAIVGIRGLTFGIEFVGGSSVTFTGTGSATTEEVRSAFASAGLSDAVVQTTESNGISGYIVRVATTDNEQVAAAANAVAEELGFDSSAIQISTIGPDWGSSVIRASIIAFLVSIVLIILYIAIRFEYKMGIMAIVALLHDLILVMGIYALVGREVTPNTIAALLTILGYSLYDTVVVFHRINDNMQGEDIKCTFMSMANHSINQVLLRTINTTLTSLVPVLAMLFFGGETLKDFAFAMAIGLVSGSYSSIAVAVPLYSIWKTREQRYSRLVGRYGADVVQFEFAVSSPTVLPAEIREARKARKAEKKTVAPVAAAAATGGGEGGGAPAAKQPAEPKLTVSQRKRQAQKKHQQD